VQDLLFLRESGIEAGIKRAAANGIPVIGICGGYQILGQKIHDPHNVESPRSMVEGLGLLDVETTFDKIKTTCQVEAVENAECGVRNAEWDNKEILKGYEIHMGRTTGDVGLFRLKRLSSASAISDPQSEINDGSRKGGVWGTYIHGIFDNDNFRRDLLNSLRTTGGAAAIDDVTGFAEARDEALDRWAGVLRMNIDMQFIEKLIRN
jgi:adenosylcobyric acid synthase